MFTPSSVMLIAVRGRPLTIAFRLPFGADTPGSRFTKSIALRVVSGIFVIWFVLTVVEIADDCVCTTSELDDTVTCSVIVPTSSTAFTCAPAPDVRTTSSMITDLKPCRAIVTVYSPTARPGREKIPSAFETVVDTTPVALCFAVTSAPGITPPDESTTVPDNVLVPWANAVAAPRPTSATMRNTSRNGGHLRFI